MFLFRKNKTIEDDLSLINRFKKNGDKECIGILFERYTYLVYGVCMKFLNDEEKSKDAVMEIFEKVIYELHRHEISNFSSWLHSLARNFCLMQLRSEKSIQEKAIEWKNSELLFMELSDNMHQNYASIEKEMLLQKLELAVEQLNNEQKRCIQLFYFEQKSYHEIAEITGYDLKKVKSFLQNGKRNLENIMRKNNGK